MVQKLLVQGIDIQKATTAFTTPDGHSYSAASFVISMAQPKMGLIKNLLDRNFFPDNDWTRDKNGDPIRPYDLSTDAMNEFMGVRVDHVAGPLKDGAGRDYDIAAAAGQGKRGRGGYVLSAKLDNSFKAVNLLQTKGVVVSRIEKMDAPMADVALGDFVVAEGLRSGDEGDCEDDGRRLQSAGRAAGGCDQGDQAAADRAVPALLWRQCG